MSITWGGFFGGGVGFLCSFGGEKKSKKLIKHIHSRCKDVTMLNESPTSRFPYPVCQLRHALD